MNHYLIIDAHNSHKGHHISFDQNGQIFYNQAIFNERHLNKKEAVEGHEGWYDFYEDEQVTFRGSHGYQEYIDRAHHKWLSEKPLEVEDIFEDNFNQADRTVEIVAISGDEALGYYTMPKGRSFLCIYHRITRIWKRSQAIKTLPKKWLKELSDVEYQWIKSEIA